MVNNSPPASSPNPPAAGLAGVAGRVSATPASSITIDLPTPPSVNRTVRRRPPIVGLRTWNQNCDGVLLAAKLKWQKPIEIFELEIVFTDQARIDLDNGLKVLIDYLRRVRLIKNDAKKNLRRLTVSWGYAPFGCRVTIKPIG